MKFTQSAAGLKHADRSRQRALRPIVERVGSRLLMTVYDGQGIRYELNVGSTRSTSTTTSCAGYPIAAGVGQIGVDPGGHLTCERRQPRRLRAHQRGPMGPRRVRVSQIAFDRGGDLYALNLDDHKIYQHASGVGWLAVGGFAGQIAADGDGYLYALNLDDHKVYERVSERPVGRRLRRCVSDRRGSRGVPLRPELRGQPRLPASRGSSWYAVGQFQPDRRLNGGGYLYALNLDDHKVYEHVGWDQWAVRPRQRLPDRVNRGGYLYALSLVDGQLYEHSGASGGR